VDNDGNLHRKGAMRLSTAADEILSMKDPRVQGLPAYLIIILLSRVVIKLGTVQPINPAVIEGLFSEDLAYLQALYNRINALTAHTMTVDCPHCSTSFEVEVPLPGGS
jgi:hypothetical protein